MRSRRRSNRAALIKSPVDLVVGTLRTLRRPTRRARCPFALAAAPARAEPVLAAQREGLAGRRGVDQSTTLLQRKQFLERLFRGQEMRADGGWRAMQFARVRQSGPRRRVRGFGRTGEAGRERFVRALLRRCRFDPQRWRGRVSPRRRTHADIDPRAHRARAGERNPRRERRGRASCVRALVARPGVPAQIGAGAMDRRDFLESLGGATARACSRRAFARAQGAANGYAQPAHPGRAERRQRRPQHRRAVRRPNVLQRCGRASRSPATRCCSSTNAPACIPRSGR